MSRAICFLSALLSALAFGQLIAAEAWSATGLPVRDGLQLWLDATRQSAARQQLGLLPLAEGRPVDAWLDGSGKGRHLVQRANARQPRFHQNRHGGWVSFDGEDDFLSTHALGAALTNATVVIYAAVRENPGGYRAFLGLNALGRDDYQTGLNLDLGPAAAAQLEALNAEGSGFGGTQSLLQSPVPLGRFHRIQIEVSDKTVLLRVNGQPQKSRSRRPGPVRMDEITLGARFYSADAQPPLTRGFLAGEIAEVLVYDKILSNAEQAALDRYLADKFAHLSTPDARALSPLASPVTNAPPVQMFVPGFSVQRLPVEIKNINNVRYRADGKLVAVGYNGHVYILSDTDGDGLEDTIHPYWDRNTLRSPIGMALAPAGYPGGPGVFIAAKGKVVFLPDTDGDDRADGEVIVADGWRELPVNVDALGVALAPDGSVYFGLGTTDFTDAYLTRAGGGARYDLKSERGTILKVSPDFSSREIVCTGIRFPVALAFNRHGDLFCTDQEGATWLPNGNPLDELLHIQPGRHYGFPPRHPQHLPGVIDEPSTFDYAPQHQSLCGFAFNEPVNGGPRFGPSWWAGDAILAGESRGKLYRTKLVQTPHGYVAQNQIIGSFTNLLVDVCVSPRGDLVASVHSGKPDWGTGPEGAGTLYKIRQTAPALPQPVLAWAESPTRTRVAFDRPVPPAFFEGVMTSSAIVAGRFVSAGDRFEVLWPGYAVVDMEKAAPRDELPVLSAQLNQERTALLLETQPRAEAVQYAVVLPGSAGAPAATNALSQHNAIDLQFDLTGVQASWSPAGVGEPLTTWLPHLELAVARELTQPIADHREFFQRLRQPGELTLRCQLDLWQMLRPATQPGSTLDHTLPPERVSVVFSSSTAFTVKTRNETHQSTAGDDGRHELSVTVTPTEHDWVPVEIVMATRSDAPDFGVAWFTAEDPRVRPFPLRRFLLPWARSKPDAPVETITPEIEGGNWLAGRRLFHSEQLACAKCHRVNGQGGSLGPNLSNLVHRDYASVLKDIREPNAALNPDHIAHDVTLTDGEVLSGLLLRDNPDSVVLADAGAELKTIARGLIKEIKPSALSLMPEGLADGLDAQGLKDLMTFLLTRPLEPAPIEREGAPPPRSLAVISPLLDADLSAAQSAKPLRILLSAGPKDHGPGEHDYPLWQQRWKKLLALGDNVRVSTCMGFPSPEQFQDNDVVVFYSNNPGWTAERAIQLDTFLERGGGLVCLHYAVDGHAAPDVLAQRIGLAWRGGHSRFRHGLLNIRIADETHPIARGIAAADFSDETYWNLVGDEKRVHLLGHCVEEGHPRPQIWTMEQGRGRVFVSIIGHYTWTFDDPLYRLLVLRGICWTAREPVDRLNELTTVGARVSE